MVSNLEQINSRRFGLTDKAKYEAGALNMLDAVCEYIMTHPTYAVQPEIYAEGVKQAMMKGG